MHDAAAYERICRKFVSLFPVLDERSRRHWAGSEALELGRGGIALVAAATGMARDTVRRGVREGGQADPETPWTTRIRQSGGGRKPLTALDPELVQALESLVDPLTRGDPESPLRWTCKSTRKLAEELSRQRHSISDRTVARLLYELGYSLQANRKTREGGKHADRNAQFEYINSQAKRFRRQGQPVISVDTKKKELVGDFKNPGQEWQPEWLPEEVRTHDFKDPKLGKAIPYGVYDVTNNQGWVSVGIDHDTAYFAAASIRRWWREMGAQRFPRANKLLINADGGGSNSSRSRLWKVALQDLADALQLRLSVCHFPPGTSKWNKVEHRLFCFITQNWRGRPLVSLQTIVNLIANTTTRQGLIVKAALDPQSYETGIKVSDEQLATLALTRADFHGEWNYVIAPRKRS